ncbi:hypothetical protein [Parageobacillus galactosidasius]|uniref:DUF4177 domain-containing protein n=1 Tax=Parageobacillus galactosidasius TaxID=883812 RepID=A0A226QT03_9BACL|nr:hypothetical protein [Parageobacillus galactosidasius]OXB94817.1 hypothetical protein B9L23_08115 [Parageobacillus galactosidasius]
MICIDNQLVGQLKFAYKDDKEMEEHTKKMKQYGWKIVNSYFDILDNQTVQVLVYQKHIGYIELE